MTAPLAAEYKAVDPILFTTSYFKPLGASNAIAPKRWATGMVMPYRWVEVVSNPRAAYASWPVVRVHTLAATYTAAAIEANRTDARAQVLVDYPGWPVTLPDSSIVKCFFAEITEAAHEEPYAAETVATRFVSEYRFGIGFTRA